MRLATRSALALSATLALATVAGACGVYTTGFYADRAFASAATRPADYAGPLLRFTDVRDVALAGPYAFTVESDGMVRLYRLRDGAELMTDVQGDAARLSADGRFALTNYKGRVKLWDLKVPQYGQSRVVHDQPAIAMGFSPDAKRLYLVPRDRPNSALVLDAATFDKLVTLEIPHEDISAVALAPDGRHAITGSRTQGEGERAFHSRYLARTSHARLWDWSTGKEIAQRPYGPADLITAAGFTLDGHYACVNGQSIWTTPDAARPEPIPGDGLLPAAKRAQQRGPVILGEGDYARVGEASVPIQCAAFSADQSRLLVGTGPACYDAAGVPGVALFDAKTQTLLAHFKGHGARVTHVTFSADNRHALARDAAGAAVVYALPR